MAAAIEDERLTARILDKIKGGNFPVVAARACGLSESTFRLWMIRGKEEAEGPYHDFYEAISTADAENEAVLVEYVMDAAQSDVKAAIEVLQRRHGQRWGKTDYTKIKIETDDHDEPVEVRDMLSDPDVRRGLSIALKTIAQRNALPEPETAEGEYRAIEPQSENDSSDERVTEEAAQG